MQRHRPNWRQFNKPVCLIQTLDPKKCRRRTRLWNLADGTTLYHKSSECIVYSLHSGLLLPASCSQALDKQRPTRQHIGTRWKKKTRLEQHPTSTEPQSFNHCRINGKGGPLATSAATNHTLPLHLQQHSQHLVQLLSTALIPLFWLYMMCICKYVSYFSFPPQVLRIDVTGTYQA